MEINEIRKPMDIGTPTPRTAIIELNTENWKTEHRKL
jgi:hypothetical protein